MFLSKDLTTQMGTFALLPQIIKAVNVPVIASGGIAEATGVAAAALALGAAAIQIGTAYLLCPEVTLTPVHRAALQSEGAHHTAVTNLFTGRRTGNCEPTHHRTRPDQQQRARFPLGGSSDRTVTRPGRKSRPQWVFTSLVRPECQRMC